MADNVRSLGFTKAHVVTGSVSATLARPPATPYDVVFLDPPYPLADAAVADDLLRLVTPDWLVPGAMVVVERATRSPEPAWPVGLELTRSKRYGETTLWYAESTPGKR